MLTIERELAAVIYVLYASECIHWLKLGQSAMTLRWDGTWKIHQSTEESYTLAGLMPVIVNPIDFRPAYFKLSPNQPLTIIERTTGRIIREKLPKMSLLTFFTALGALNLLIILPILLLTGFLGVWWQLVTALTIFIQIGILDEAFELAKPWRSADPASFWREYIALLINPIAALRSGDILLKGLSIIANSGSLQPGDESSDDLNTNEQALSDTVPEESGNQDSSPE